MTQKRLTETCCTLIRFSHEDTYTQQVSLRTELQADCLLFIKWKWMIKVFIFMRMGRERMGAVQEAEEVAGRQAGGLQLDKTISSLPRDFLAFPFLCTFRAVPAVPLPLFAVDSVPISQRVHVMKEVRGEAVVNTWNPPARLFRVSLSHYFSSFSSPGPVLEALISVK